MGSLPSAHIIPRLRKLYLIYSAALIASGNLKRSFLLDVHPPLLFRTLCREGVAQFRLAQEPGPPT